MTHAEQLAAFIVRASYEDLSEAARRQLKIQVLDALGCAVGALEGGPVRLIRQQIEDFGGTGHCSLIGGGRTAPDRAALYNSALVRYLDFNDSYLAEGETCHPSDNLGAVLAAAEYAGKSGREFLTALAVAYQIQCRLSDVAPVRAKGFDHTTQGAYAVAAGVAKGHCQLKETVLKTLPLNVRFRACMGPGIPFRARKPLARDTSLPPEREIAALSALS
jgi:2-methylcitrate dehydratase